MLHDLAAAWIWSLSEIADGTLGRAAGEEITDFFLRLRDGSGPPHDDGRRSRERQGRLHEPRLHPERMAEFG